MSKSATRGLRLACFLVAMAAVASSVGTTASPPADRETLRSLDFGAPVAERAPRSKRMLGLLRQLFPAVFKATDPVIQQLDTILLQVFSRSADDKPSEDEAIAAPTHRDTAADRR